MRHLFYGVLLVLTFVSASQAAPEDILIVQASEANVRKFPSLQAEVLTTLGHGSQVVEVEREGDWVRIRGAESSRIKGYIHGSLLQSTTSGDATSVGEPTNQQILDLTRRVSNKLVEVLREISHLESKISDLNQRVIRLEDKVDRHRREFRQR